MNQIELHPWLQRKDIIQWCQKHRVLVQAWAPLAQSSRFEESVLKDIAKRTGKSPAQILLRWSLQKVSYVPCEVATGALTDPPGIQPPSKISHIVSYEAELGSVRFSVE